LNHVLLVKRNNEPAKDQWWFPGGRVLHGELRSVEAKRKLKEECGIIINDVDEWKTIDIFLFDNQNGYATHAISTIFLVSIKQSEICLDNQSSNFAWLKVSDWKTKISNEFLNNILEDFSNYKM